MATTTLSRGRHAPPAPAHGAAKPPTSLVAARRSAPLVVAGMTCMLLGGLAAAALYLRIDNSRSVLVLARPVAAGQLFTDRDLTQTSLAATGIASVPAARRAQVIGRPAAVDLPAGSLLTPVAVGEPAGLQRGEAVVGLALKGNQAPSQLRAGDRVAIIDVEPTSAGSPAAATAATGRQPATLTDAATVVSAGQRDASSTTTLSVRIPRSAAEQIAAAAASGRATVVLLPSEP